MYAGDFNAGTDGGRDIFSFATGNAGTISGEVFNDTNRNGNLDLGERGLPYWTVYLDTNNNGTLDMGEPFVLTGDTYTFQNLSAGTYKVRVVPQSGYTQTAPAATPTITLNAANPAATGVNFGEVLPLPDLAVSNVAFTPAGVHVGQSVTVTWTVTNLGTAPTTASWEDAVYLSPTPTLGAGAILLTTALHGGGLAIGQHYSGSTTAELPPKPGTYYVIVQTDELNQVREGDFNAGKANNVAVSPTTLPVTYAQLTLGTPASAQLTAAGPDQYYTISPPAGQSLVVTVASGAAGGQIELYVMRGGLPTPYDFDFTARVPGQTRQTVTVPTTQAGTYFILVHGVSGGVLGSTFTITATEPGLAVRSLGLTSGGNGGRVTIPVRGTDLTPNTQVTLVSGSSVLTPVSVVFQDASLLYATFNLAGQPAGSYTLHVANGNQSASLSNAFTVEQAQGPNLSVNLEVPDGIRYTGNAAHAEIIVEYENDGDTDMPAPIFQMAADYGTIGVLTGGASAGGASAGSAIQFVGTGGDSPAGVLRAGDKGKVTILLQLPAVVGIGGGGGGGGTSGSGNTVNGHDGVNITLSTLPTDTTPIDWSQFETQFRPPSVPASAFHIVYNHFTSAVGSTAGQLQSALVADTAFLNQIGIENPSVADLLAFQMLLADDALPTPTLGGTTDLSFPAPGAIGFGFGRRFLQSLSGRNTVGDLGLGWVSDWDTAATTESDGTVLVEDAGAPRLFTPNADGSFTALPGDYGTLSKLNGLFQLRERDGTVTTFLANGKLNSVQDTNGNRITAAYNTSGQMTSLTHSDGQVLTLAYNSQGFISSITDPTNRATLYTYDAAGHLVQVAGPGGTTHYTYVTGTGTDADNALASITAPDGTQTHYTYDTTGRLSGAFNGTAATPINPVTVSYPSLGGVAFTDANGHTTTVLFTNLGQPGEVIDPLGNVTRFTYDSAGQLLGTLLPGGGTYLNSYDANGNLLSQTAPLGLTTNYTYDTRNNLTSYTDARGNTTSYTHDDGNNLLSVTYANGAQQQYSYDALGNATGFINARGNSITSTYDAQGNLSAEGFADGTSYAFTYDARGNMTSATDGQGHATTFTYGGDPNNPANPDLLTEVQYPDGTFLKFTYSAGGRRQQSLDQTGFTVNYTYDAAGNLTKLTDAGGNTIAQYTYDNAGQLIRKDNGNGTRTVYTYDAAGNERSITNYAPDHTTVNSFDNYTYDALGNVLTDTNQDGQWVYTYDADSQLTAAVFTLNGTNPDGLTAQHIQYTYDAAGNRVTETVNGVTTTYVANNVNEYTSRTTAGVGTTTYQYDLDGNLISQTDPSNATTNYTFNDLNQLTGVSGLGLAASYFCDTLGNRVSQTINGTTTNFQVDPTGFGNIGLGTVVAAFDGSGVYNNSGGLLAHYTYGLGLVSRVGAGGAAGYFDFGLTGNTTGLTDATGAYVNKYAYQPFGQTTTLSAGVANPFTYVGRFGVSSDGSPLLSMGLRQFNPVTGQFVSNDPIGLAGGDSNLRRYAGNDPIANIDPAGLQYTEPDAGQESASEQKADADVLDGINYAEHT